MIQDVLGVEDIEAFVQELFARDEKKAARILKAVLEARSARLSDLSPQMEGNASANYKMLARFLKENDVLLPLMRLFDESAPFVIGDPTEIARPQAKKTPYVGRLKDGKTRGFLVFLFGFPYRGRVIPFGFVSYSSATIAQETTSRNREHCRALASIRRLLGEIPVVLDREFSYEALFADFRQEGLHFVIRLNTGNRAEITDAQGARVDLSLSVGETKVWENVFYKKHVPVHIAGVWERGFSEPWWVITDLEPQKALELYGERMKIEESFKDLKDLLHLDTVMTKSRENMEKMVALMLLAYGIGRLLGEGFRDALYEKPPDENPSPPSAPLWSREATQPSPRQERKKRTKWECYSGLFVLLKQRIRLPEEVIRSVIAQALESFRCLIQPFVLTHT